MNIGWIAEADGVGDWVKRAELLSQFPVVRMMNAAAVNFLPSSVRDMPETRDDLPMAGSCWQPMIGEVFGEWRGMPYSEQVDFINSMPGVRGWFCLPHSLMEWEMSHVAWEIVRRADVMPIIEVSNERWNASFLQWAGTAGKLAAHVRVTERLAESLGDSADVVLGGQFWSLDKTAEIVGYLREGHEVHGLAVAPYVGHRLDAVGRSAESVHEALMVDVSAATDQMVVLRDLAMENGFAELMAYEGGLHTEVRPGSGSPAEVAAAMCVLGAYNESGEAFAPVRELWLAWRDAGGGVACPYSLSSRYRDWNGRYFGRYFGHTDNLRVLPKFAAAVGVLGKAANEVVHVQEKEAQADKIDLLPYLRGAVGLSHELQRKDGGGERIWTEWDGDEEWYIVKGENVRVWEHLAVRGGAIWRGWDTSQSDLLMYRQWEPGERMARWCPQFAAVGEEWAFPEHLVEHYDKRSGATLQAGRNVNRGRLVAVHDSFLGVVQDVVEIWGLGDDGKPVEKYWFARGRSLVGHEHLIDGQWSRVVELHGVGERVLGERVIPEGML